MAKGLKVGDAVTVREEMRLPRKSDVYQQGLRRLRRGDVGQVIGMAEGRSVIVEFEGKQIILASQRLEKITPTNGESHGNGEADGIVQSDIELVDYNNPRFITSAANKLLKAIDITSPETVVVQIRMID